MSEISADIHNKVNHLKHNIKDTAKAIDWRINPDAREAREDLLKISSEIADFKFDNLPKILQLNIDGDQYVSIRRQEGNILYKNEDKVDDPYGSKTVFEVDPKLFPDGSVGLLVVPIGAHLVNKELEKALTDADEDGWMNWEFEEFISDGKFEYKTSDWKVTYTKVLFKRVRDSFFKLETNERDKFDERPIVSNIKAVNGSLPLYIDERYWSDKELQIKRDWYNKSTRMYVLLKGSSGSEKAGLPIKNLVAQKIDSF